MEPTSTLRRVQRVRHELRIRDLQVVRSERIGTGFARIVFGGPELQGFVSLGFDDHVKLILPGTQTRRDYTPRHFDAQACELTIDFALHGHGAASDWAAAARPGDRATVGGPRGSMVVPLDHDWHLLVGDAAAAPAIARRLAELPAGAHAIVIALLHDDAILDLPACRARLDCQRVGSPEALLSAVRALALPAGEGFAWGGGEATLMAAVRDTLLQQHGHPLEAMRVSAYWKRGTADYHE